MYPIIAEKEKQTSALEIAKYLPHFQQHFLKPNFPLVYADFLLTSLVGDALLLYAIFLPAFSPLQLFCMFLSAILLFRAAVFIHEAFHLSKHTKYFLLTYNLVHGFLHKLPYYCYLPHRYHHAPETYGTRKDPEYEAFGEYSNFYNLVIGPWVMMAVITLFFVIRWGILPFFLPFIGARAREWVYVNASTLVIHKEYKRAAPTEEDKKSWYWQDFGCAVYTLACFGLMEAGVLPWSALLVWYGTHYFLWVINFYRVIISHRYFTQFENTTHKQQVLDTGTLTFSWGNAWMYPLGLRYHALHHMLPQVPSHNLGKAHRWLMETLPQDHPYRVTVSDNYFHGLKAFIKRTF